MIPAVMMYAVFVAALLGVAAAVADAGLRRADLPTRWVWVVALVATVVWPVTAPFVQGFGLWEVPIVVGGDSGLGGGDGVGAAWWAGADRLVVVLWLVASGTVCSVFLRSVLMLAGAQRRWRADHLAGHRVLVSDDVGPAVVGFLRCAIVVPAWVFDSDRQFQELMISHEHQHLRARDPLLLVMAGAALVIMPWNLPLWWIAARLRTAAEVDCDARVIRERRSDIPAYGALLLHMGCRVKRTAPSMALSWPISGLERRIRAMTSRAQDGAGRRSPAGAVAALVTVAGLWMVPHPVRQVCEDRVASGTVTETSSVIGVQSGSVRVVRVLDGR